MGRGRQKAKATRQAREIKYYSPATDLSALQNELGGSQTTSSRSGFESDEPDYSEYADKYADDYEDDVEGGPRR
ncbi:DUF3073 domain-containing protein [Arthrobacter sp. UM1]|uniref:DUF3073 domain-containing protein n=1 Tax=Arthrobacter sp. UM1 TaxID=2766776 RepID=UPI001CF63614|nr:DUF3073 domain-containing protein [Arthrobacter sp. UM1]MCB4209025.1 DUF3073 domain-containing protein [Arthrobacter sp. UM1]